MKILWKLKSIPPFKMNSYLLSWSLDCLLLFFALTGQRVCESVRVNVHVCVWPGRSTQWEAGWWIERPRNPSASPLFMSSHSPPGLVYLLYLSQIILFIAEPLGNTSSLGQRGEEKGSSGDEWRPRERRRRGRDGQRSPRKQVLSLGQQTGPRPLSRRTPGTESHKTALCLLSPPPSCWDFVISSS